jgi:hypothetical protein
LLSDVTQLVLRPPQGRSFKPFITQEFLHNKFYNSDDAQQNTSVDLIIIVIENLKSLPLPFKIFPHVLTPLFVGEHPTPPHTTPLPFSSSSDPHTFLSPV